MSFSVRPWLRYWHNYWLSKPFELDIAGLRGYEWLDQIGLGVHFLFLTKNDINSVLKIPVANFCRLQPCKFILGTASLWPPEIPIVYHRHKQDGGSTSCCFVRWPKPNTIARLKSKHLAHLRILGWLCYCCVWFVDPTFPDSKSKVLLELCMKLLTLV